MLLRPFRYAWLNYRPRLPTTTKSHYGLLESIRLFNFGTHQIGYRTTR
jgi:hypothetical protein